MTSARREAGAHRPLTERGAFAQAPTLGTQVTDAVSERLQGGLVQGANAMLVGQGMDLSKADDAKGLAETLTGLARTLGAPDAPANDDDPFARHGLADPWNGSATTTTTRTITGRELLLGSSFHVAGTGEGSGPALAAWGRVAQAGFDGEHADDAGRTGVDGEVLTVVLGADADFGRLLARAAISLCEGDGSFDNAGADVGKSGDIESTMTVVSPYARFRATERVAAWGLAGCGTGDMTIRFDDGSMAPVRLRVRGGSGASGRDGLRLAAHLGGRRRSRLRGQSGRDAQGGRERQRVRGARGDARKPASPVRAPGDGGLRRSADAVGG